ncbi:MAG: Mur ligase domain-containing protein, partial [Deltaproteobacteria bacterium]
MIKLRVKDILDATGGSLIAGNRDSFINGISTDSRGIKKGELFFALKGPRFDGNKFVRDALSKGASGAVVSAPVSDLQSQNP